MDRGQIRVLCCGIGMIAGTAVPWVGAQSPPATVVTHGYQLSGSVSDWPYALADTIAQRAADQGGEAGRVLVYDPVSGDLLPCQEVWCTASGTAHTVIVFDWAADSNESGAGFSEAAAEALFAGLVSWSQGEPPLVDLGRLHLIGHSRGAVVNSEVAERLIAAGLPPPQQVTSLDPHDAGGGFVASGQVPEGGLDDYDVNQEHPEYDCHVESATPGVCAWQGVGYHDNYWRDDGGCGLFDPDGRELFGASNFYQNELDAPFCHSDTHRWYLMTADPDLPIHPITGQPPGPDWFGTASTCTDSPRTAPLARSADGYNLSIAAGGDANRCPTGPLQAQMVLFDFALSEGLVNGDFERIRPSGTQAGWSFHGGSLQGVSGTDPDNHWILTGGESALHNRFYLPEETLAIQLCRRVAVDSDSSQLSFTISSHAFPDREMLGPGQQGLGTVTDWHCLEAPVLPGETGHSVQIEVSVSGPGSAVVWIDDLRLRPGIFADGFESGDTGAWSSTSQ